MIVKIWGAILIIIGCGSFGYIIAYNAKRETASLRQLISALEYMECELNCRLTPLPQLFRMTSTVVDGCIKNLLLSTAHEMDKLSSFNAKTCIMMAAEKCRDIPPVTRRRVHSLSQSMGNFDLNGQIKCIRAENAENIRVLTEISNNQNQRIKGYKTLSLCAGAALIILFF